MTAIEHRELKGITIKNLVVTIVSTASIVVSVTTSYFQLRNDIHDIKTTQESQARVNEIRLKVLESNVAMLQEQVNEFKNQLKH
jgi:cell division protein FtsL